MGGCGKISNFDVINSRRKFEKFYIFVSLYSFFSYFSLFKKGEMMLEHPNKCPKSNLIIRLDLTLNFLDSDKIKLESRYHLCKYFVE